MRRDNSDFITEFVTNAGDFKENRDFFAFVELDDLACWVIAKGLDTATDKLSSEIVVGSIINDFTEKPSIKRRAIKKYIKNAHKALLNESRVVKLHASVLVVVSDYSSIVYASAGNIRLYHLHKDKISLKSKDHSVAQIMLDAGEIDEIQLNHHIEKNNLTKYLGQKKRISPLVSKRIKLSDTDTIVACTPGYWGNINDHKLEDILKESEEPGDYVLNLEQDLLDNIESELPNYTVVTIFTKKVFKEVEEKKNLYKKVAVFLIPILMLAGGFGIYQKVKSINAQKAARMLMDQKITTTQKEVVNGDELYKEGKYEEALAAYIVSRDNYLELDKRDEAAKIQSKITMVEYILEGKKHEQEGLKNYNSANYQAALQSFEEAKVNYLKSNNYNIDEIDKNINKTRKVIEAINYENEGDKLLKAKNYALAREKYSAAGAIYLTYELLDKNNALSKKISECDTHMTIDSKLETARKIETAGDEFFNLQQFDEAVIKYIEAKVIYTELNMSDRVAVIDGKMKKVDEMKASIIFNEKLQMAEALEKEGDTLYFLVEMTQANLKYSQARSIYQELELTDRATQVEQKLQKIEQSKLEKDREERINQAVMLTRSGDEALQLKNYNDANQKYTEAKAIYSQLNMIEEAGKIDEKIRNINISKNMDEIEKYIRQGDIQLTENNFDEALFNYRQASKIAVDNGFHEEENRIRELINTTTLRKYRTQADRYEKTGDMLLEEKKYSEAIFNYKQARNIYLENNITDGIQKMDEKIKNAENREKYNTAQLFESEADLKFNNKKYEDALINYENALKIYQEINLDADTQRVTNKINQVKEAQKTIIDKIKELF